MDKDSRGRHWAVPTQKLAPRGWTHRAQALEGVGPVKAGCGV